MIEKNPPLLSCFFFFGNIARALEWGKAAVRVMDWGGVGLFLFNLGVFWIYKGDVGLGGNESSFSEIGNW